MFGSARCRRLTAFLGKEKSDAEGGKAFAFMTRVALLAKKTITLSYWINVWNKKAEIYLSVHNAGNIVTERDRKLATAIDKLL